jgi:hypothetical protein
MVLQTYYHNLDNTYNKLQTINEYMDDIEAGRFSWLAPHQISGLQAQPYAMIHLTTRLTGSLASACRSS